VIFLATNAYQQINLTIAYIKADFTKG